MTDLAPRPRIHRTLAWTLSLALLGGGCGEGEEPGEVVVAEVVDEKPVRPIDRTGAGPATDDPAEAIRRDEARRREGARLYRKDCAGCHGLDGQGSGYNVRLFEQEPLPSLVRDRSIARIGRERFLAALREGAGVAGERPWNRMPGYAATYGPEDEEALVAHVTALPGLRFEPEVNLSPSKETKCQPCHASAGEQLLRELNCAGCHEMDGHERRAVGPDLSDIGSRYRKPWILAFLGRPYNRHFQGYLPLETNRMPDFQLPFRYARPLAHFLGAQRRPDLPPAPDLDDPDQALIGEKLFRIEGCDACHEIANYGGRIGPELSGAGLRITPEWLLATLDDPRRLRPDSSMPRPSLTDDARLAIASYLYSRRSKYPGVINPVLEIDPQEGMERPREMAALEGVDTFPEPADEEEDRQLMAEGRRVFLFLGCRGCHDLAAVDDVPHESVGPPLDSAGLRLDTGWTFDFLRIPRPIRDELPTVMPRLHLTAQEAMSAAYTLEERSARLRPDLAARLAAIDASADPARTPDPAAGRQAFVARDCHSCHAVGDETFPPVGNAYFEGREQEHRRRWAPDLGHAGRLRRAALVLQIIDPEAVEPGTRMPRIGIDRQEAEAIADFLLAE